MGFPQKIQAKYLDAKHPDDCRAVTKKRADESSRPGVQATPLRRAAHTPISVYTSVSSDLHFSINEVGLRSTPVLQTLKQRWGARAVKMPKSDTADILRGEAR
jgi:hypothetical protein